MVGIYKITSPSGKIYIGQSKNIERRFRAYHYPKGCPNQVKLNYSFKKHGSRNHLFEIAHELPTDVTQSILDTYELLYWQMYRDAGVETMNMKEPGTVGKFLPETLKKMSESQKRKNDRIGRLSPEEKDQRKQESRKKARESGYFKEYSKRPGYKERQKQWDARSYAKHKDTPEFKARIAERDKKRYEKLSANPEWKAEKNRRAKEKYHAKKSLS